MEIVLIQNPTNLGNPAIHHVRGRHHVGPGLGMGKRGPGKHLQGGVVVHHIINEYPAMAMAGIFAQADIGTDRQLWRRVLQLLDGPLDDAVLGMRPRTFRILLVGQTEKDDRVHPKAHALLGLLGQLVHGHSEHPGHGWHLFPDSLSRHDKKRVDKMGRRNAGLPDKRPEGFVLPEPAGPVFRKNHGLFSPFLSRQKAFASAYSTLKVSPTRVLIYRSGVSTPSLGTTTCATPFFCPMSRRPYSMA